MKWLLSLMILTSFFIVSSFFISAAYVFPYRWMTFGMAIVSFIFYFMVNRSNAKNIGGNIASISVKFILSSLIVVLYIAIFRSKNSVDYYFFILAYITFSVVSYTGAYYSVKAERNNNQK